MLLAGLPKLTLVIFLTMPNGNYYYVEHIKSSEEHCKRAETRSIATWSVYPGVKIMKIRCE